VAQLKPALYMAEETKKEEQKNKEYWEARQNLFGFFSLLLEVDRRVNPHLYKKQPKGGNKNNKDNPNA
jgi:hypothetical protein